MTGLKVVLNVSRSLSNNIVTFDGCVLGFPEDLRGNNLVYKTTNGELLSVSHPQLVIDSPEIRLYVWGDNIHRDTDRIYQEGEFSDFEVGKILDTFYDLVTSFNKSIGSSERPVINTWEGLG